MAVETVQKNDSGLDDAEEQTNFRRQLLAEIEKQVIEFSRHEVNDPLYMPARDFIIEQFRILSQLTAKPEYLDQDIVDKCTQVIYKLVLLQDSLFDIVLEAESGSFRDSYFKTLENLNLYARENNIEWTIGWVRHQLEQTMDKMCTWVDLPQLYSYGNAKNSELGFSLLKFDRSTALQSKRGVM